MKHFMLTAAAIALTTPAWAQQATTTEAPAGTVQTAPAEDGATTGTGAATGTMGGTAQDGAVMTQPGMGQTDMGQTGMDGTMTRRSSADLGATLSPENQGITASWLTDRSVYTTNQPSNSQWNDVAGGNRPDDWNDIGSISDLVLTPEGELIGYVADIGGFLGLGTHTVLLDGDMLHVARFDDEIVMATNFTQEELEAMPEFDPNNVMAD